MSTNYINTFISVAPDSPARSPEAPPMNPGKPTVATLQFEILSGHPYEMTSDDLLFAVHVARTHPEGSDLAAARADFFAKDQACLRASPLGKRYGWGTHHDQEGRVALVGVGTPEYDRLLDRNDITQKSAMRSNRG